MTTIALLWEYTVVTVISHKLLVHIKITAENNTHVIMSPESINHLCYCNGPVTLLYICNFISIFCCLLQDEMSVV